MKGKLKLLFACFSFSLLLPFCYEQSANASSYKLTSFNAIRSIEVSEEEKKANIINFNEFTRIFYHNYILNKSDNDKNKLLVKLNSDINTLKYSDNIQSERKPPVILHWTDADNAMGVVKTLFKERAGMKEGIIGVDYVVTEPLLHPDYPNRLPRSYSIKLSRSEVATTWFHIPDKAKAIMPDQDRKYNKAINIEIVGWRFFKNENGKKNDFSRVGKKGIREDYDGNYDKVDDLDEDKYSTYPTVLKLVNYLAEKHNFASVVDEFEYEKEVDKELKDNKGVIYLKGPLSQYIKGHGLIALEHTLMFGSTYIKERHDFIPSELLALYSDLKDYRKHLKDLEIVKNLEERLNVTEKLSNLESQKIKDSAEEIKSKNKKDFILTALYINSLKINTLDKLNIERKSFDVFPTKEKDKLTAHLITRFLSDADSVLDTEYDYLKSIIVSFKDNSIKDKLSQSLYDRYAYSNKKKTS